MSPKKVVPNVISAPRKVNKEHEGGWKQIHIIITVIGMVVAFTIGALNYFVSAQDFDKFQKDVVVYQLEDQITKSNDRIIELNKQINSEKLTSKEKADRIAEKEKLEKRVENLNKKLDYVYPGVYQTQQMPRR